MSRRKTIGVMGGMGPAATVEFFRRLVASSVAVRDQDHFHILIDNDPSVPSRIEAILDGGASPEPALISMAKRLERAGAEVLAMPCNTAHYYLEAIRAQVGIPSLNMLDETASTVDVRRVGLLATTGTIHSRLYERALTASGIDLVVPSEADQRDVMGVIERIKGGISPDLAASTLRPIVADLRDAGAEAVIAGCTEISLVPGHVMSIRWIDALDCLVEATIREAGGSSQGEEAQ